MRLLPRRARDVIMSEGTEGRNPFEVLTLAWSAYVGASLAFGSPVPNSVQELIPQWMVATWYILLCIGGLVGLVGVWLRNQLLSLLVERAAMTIFSPSALLYAVALFSFAGARAIPNGLGLMVFAIGATWRAVRITVFIKAKRSEWLSGGKT